MCGIAPEIAGRIDAGVPGSSPGLIPASPARRCVKRVVIRVIGHRRGRRFRLEAGEILAQDGEFRHVFPVEVNAGPERIAAYGFLYAGVYYLEYDIVLLELDLSLGRMDVDIY